MSARSPYKRLFADLKRRNVFRVAAVYGGTGFVLLQVAELLAEGLALPASVLRITTLAVIIGFPIAMILAWALEITPEGVKRTDPAMAGEIEAIIRLPATRRWPSGILALLGMVALMGGAWWAGRRSAAGDAASGAAAAAEGAAASSQAVLRVAYADLSDDTRPAIAVLPFADMSQAQDQEYFTDGITEELLNTLAKIRALRVAGRTSSFAYKGQDRDLREIGAELGVRYLVEGSVRKQGTRLRITAQLIDAADNFHIWSDAYDRELDDVFLIQSEIAEEIAGQLQVSLGLEEGAQLVTPTHNLEAFELYLSARAHIRDRGAGVREAVRLLEQATQMDPSWAPAWASLAQAHALVPYYPASGAPQPDSAAWAAALDAAEDAARHALVLDSQSAPAEVALGNVNRDRWRWADAELHYLRALAIDPDDAEAHQQYAEYLGAVGRLDEALRSARRALELDATPVIKQNVVAYLLILNDRVADAAAFLEPLVAARPMIAYPYENLARAYLLLDDLDAAMAVLETAPADAFDRRQLEPLRRAWRDRDGNAFAACCAEFSVPEMFAALGDTARAIAAIRHGVLDGPPFRGDVAAWIWAPSLDAIRADPRLQPVLRRLGLEDAVPRRVGE
jgi:TolB-like protein